MLIMRLTPTIIDIMDISHVLHPQRDNHRYLATQWLQRSLTAPQLQLTTSIGTELKQTLTIAWPSKYIAVMEANTTFHPHTPPTNPDTHPRQKAIMINIQTIEIKKFTFSEICKLLGLNLSFFSTLLHFLVFTLLDIFLWKYEIVTTTRQTE